MNEYRPWGKNKPVSCILGIKGWRGPQTGRHSGMTKISKILTFAYPFRLYQELCHLLSSLKSPNSLNRMELVLGPVNRLLILESYLSSQFK